MKTLDRGLLSVMALVVLLLLLNTWFAYQNIRQMHEDARIVFALVMVLGFIFLLRRHLLARERNANAIYEQRETFRTTLASIGDAVMTTDTEGRVTYLNTVAQSLTGWTQEDAVGRPLENTFHIVNEQTRAPVENPVARVLREGVIVGLANHTLLIAKDGTERPIDDSAAPIRDRGENTVGVVMVFRDVTERRHAETALQDANTRSKNGYGNERQPWSKPTRNIKPSSIKVYLPA